MAKDYGDGVWRTINGRRVFIAEGQSLGDAMKKSGKFGKVSKVKDVRKNTFKDEISQGDKNKFAMGYGLSKDAVKGYAKARQDERDAKKDYKVKEGSPIDDMIKKNGINVGGRLREVDDEAKDFFKMLDKKGVNDDEAKFLLHSRTLCIDDISVANY